jgi:hypothetical protein
LFESAENYFLPTHALLKTPAVYKYIFMCQTPSCGRASELTLSDVEDPRRDGRMVIPSLSQEGRVEVRQSEPLGSATFLCESELLDIHRKSCNRMKRISSAYVV